MAKWPTGRSDGAGGTGDEGSADARAQGGAWMVKLAVAVIVVVVGVMVFRPGRGGAPAAEGGAANGGAAGGAARGAGGTAAAGARGVKRPVDDGKPPLRTTRGEVQAAANESAGDGGVGGASTASAGAGVAPAGAVPGAGDGATGGAGSGAGSGADAAPKAPPARPLPPPPAHAPPELVDLVSKAMLNRDAIAAASDEGKPADAAAAAEAKRLAGEINDWIAREADNDRRMALIEWVSQAMDPAREPPAPAPGNAP
jgi:hypothetical protein